MNTTKNIISAIFIIICNSFCYAQQIYLTPSEDLVEHQKVIETSTYIFEGTVMQQKCYYKIHVGGEVFTCSIMEINRIYRGSPQVKIGTIKLITEQGGAVGNDMGTGGPTDGSQSLILGGTYVIFGIPTTFQPADTNLIYAMKTNNLLLFTPFDQINVVGNGAQWDFANYSKLDSLYSFFQANGLTIQAQATAADSAKYKREVDSMRNRNNTIAQTPPKPAPTAPINVDTSKIYTKVQSTPLFRGNIKTYLTNNVKYPDSARAKNIQGIVWVNFVVERNGSISNVSILRSRDKSLNAEAERVIANMPNWKPGRLNGVAVRTQYMIPVSFKLQ